MIHKVVLMYRVPDKPQGKGLGPDPEEVRRVREQEHLHQ